MALTNSKKSKTAKLASGAPQGAKAAGKSLRDRVSRGSQAELKLRPRRDPLAILQKSDESRLQELVPIRYGRMLASPFAFFRGSAAIMADDLSHTHSTGIIVQACGDCHLKNFGGFATPERNIVFDINDFDETLPAPWEWDLKRLATSFVMATRANGISATAGREVTMTCVESYRKGMHAFSKLDPLGVWYSRVHAEDFLALLTGPDRQRVERRVTKATAKRGSDVDYPKLAEVVNGKTHIREVPPLIYHPEVARSSDFESQVLGVLKAYRETLTDDRRVLFDRYTFVDAAIKVVGIGSVGTRCWIALFMSHANEPLFLQFKQANASVLESYAGKSAYAHHGQRIVAGQRLVQAASDIFLGWTTGPNADFYVRQLRDAKISPILETFDEGIFLAYARACGWNLARAHAKSGDAWMLDGYIGKSDALAQAIATFAEKYADLAERDHAELAAAVKSGKIQVFVE
ncbi:MAG: DUF2252 domain-containing protein [Candidatus Eremiobacteraeota bacterium]|nr:DUF2252 domain-containing protein [Candidatus Eremiobacteraeota bacterium]